MSRSGNRQNDRTPVEPSRMGFLPTTREEMHALGWAGLDVLLVTGDAYVDHPSFGVAMVGRYLESLGLRVGICPQPDWKDASALQVMGSPALFVGVSAGNLDSMLSNYTAARHRRKEDLYSEGGQAGRRPNHAAVVYAQLARRAFPRVPVILGGMEASMRRLTHYDYWEDSIRPSILAVSKADLLVYGMGERALLELVTRLREGNRSFCGIPGTARMMGGKETQAFSLQDVVELPSHEAIVEDPELLLDLTLKTEAEQSPYCGRKLFQLHGQRGILVEAPALPLDLEELDALYELPFQGLPHPRYRSPVPAHHTIKDSITVSRGCAGGCSFCGLGLHQGRFHSSRSVPSVMREIRRLADKPFFRGTVSDLGGPTANLFAARNGHTPACHKCRRPSCLWPSLCRHFELNPHIQVELLKQARVQKGVKHVFIQSGIRMDVALKTPEYLRELVFHHVSGHLKVAPEHLHPKVLKLMRKPSDDFENFRQVFDSLNEQAGKRQYLVPYFISSFPGCSPTEMADVERFLKKEQWNLQQVQDFIPLPMTPAAAMYVSGKDFYGNPIFVARHAGDRERQKRMLRLPHSKQKTRGRDTVEILDGV